MESEKLEDLLLLSLSARKDRGNARRFWMWE